MTIHFSYPRLQGGLLVVLTFLCLVSGCSPSLDSDLLDTMQKDQQAAQAVTDSFTTVQEQFLQFSQLLTLTPPDLRKGSKGAIELVESETAQYQEKLGGMLEAHRQEISRLELLAQAYRAGQTDTEKAKLAFEPQHLYFGQVKAELDQYRSYLVNLRKTHKEAIQAQIPAQK